MTDPTAPQDPSADAPHRADETIDAERAWFRAEVQPIVDAEPVSDAWPAIAARAAAAPALAAHADLAAARGRRALRWTAVAAVIALFAGAAWLATRSSGDDHASSVIAGETEAEPGWYLPKDLPAGWSLRSVEVVHAAKGAECRTRVSRTWEPFTPDGKPETRSLRLAYDRCARLADLGFLQQGPDLGNGIGHASTSIDADATGSHPQLIWEHDGLWTLTGFGIPADDVTAAAKVVAVDPQIDIGPLDGWSLKSSGRSDDSMPADAVVVTLDAPGGQVVSYQLFLPGPIRQPDPFVRDEPAEIAGQPDRIVLRDTSGTPAPIRRTAADLLRRGVSYVGTWTGADVVASPIDGLERADLNGDDPTVDAHIAAVKTMLGALRPATPAEWKAFVSTADQPPASPVTDADSLRDLLDGHDAATAPATSDPSATDPTTTTDPADGRTTVPASTTAPGATDADPGTEPGRPGPIASDTADTETIPRDRAGAGMPYTELDDLEISVELSSGSVSAMAPTPLWLVLRNTSDRDVELTECTASLLRIGVVPADDRTAKVLAQQITDCYRTPMATIAPGKTTRYRVDGPPVIARRQNPDTLLGQYLGTLPDGPATVVVEVPGATSDRRIRVPVTVDAPECATSDADIVGLLNRTEDQARAQARRAGDTIRIASVDGRTRPLESDLRCDRLNLALVGGRVTDALRY